MSERRFLNGLSIARRVMRLVPVDWAPLEGWYDDDTWIIAQIYNQIWGETWELLVFMEKCDDQCEGHRTRRIQKIGERRDGAL